MKAIAQIAFLFVVGLISVARAEDLGRLFFSPEERQQLDQKVERRAAGKEESVAQPFIVVNGIVQHSDGSRTAWINGKTQHNAPGKNPNTVPVTVPGKSRSIEVKVGQRLLLDNLPVSNSETSPAAKNSN